MATIAELEEKVSQSSKTMSKFEDQKGKKDEIDALHEDIEKNCKRVESLEIQISLLPVQLDDREKVELNLKEKEKESVENIVQVQTSLSAVECSLAEAKKKYEMMLEAKQSRVIEALKGDFSKMIGYLSPDNGLMATTFLCKKGDHATVFQGYIRMKYELLKWEIIKLEKEKEAGDSKTKTALAHSIGY